MSNKLIPPRIRKPIYSIGGDLTKKHDKNINKLLESLEKTITKPLMKAKTWLEDQFPSIQEIAANTLGRQTTNELEQKAKESPEFNEIKRTRGLGGRDE